MGEERKARQPRRAAEEGERRREMPEPFGPWDKDRAELVEQTAAMPDREAGHQEAHRPARQHPRMSEQLPGQKAIEQGAREIEAELGEEEEVLAHSGCPSLHRALTPWPGGEDLLPCVILPACQPRTR